MGVHNNVRARITRKAAANLLRQLAALSHL